MSGKQVQKIKCPKCGEEHEFTTYSSVNTAVDPELKDQIVSGALFRTVCPQCGQEIDVIYPCLYHQMEERRMIYYAPGEEAVREAQQAFSESARDGEEEDYLYRVVSSLYDLQEKIAIFDAGLDDRVVEICKILIGSEIQDAHPEAEFDDLLYYRVPDEGGRLALMREGAMFASIALPDDVYREVKERYGKLLEKTQNDTVIDMDWVVNTVNKMGG